MPPKKAKTTDKASPPFEGMVVAVSGFFNVTQAEMKKLLQDNGATIASTVTKKVTHLITNAGEVGNGTAKVQAARANKIPIVNEDFVHASLTGAGRADETKHLLDVSGAGAGAGAATASAVDADKEEEEEEEEPKRKPAAKKGAKGKAVKEEPKADEAEPEPEEDEKPKRDGKKAASKVVKAEPKSTSTAAAPAPAPAPATKAPVPVTKQASVAVDGPYMGRRPNSKAEVVFSFDTTGSMYPCLTQVRRKIQEATERLFREVPGIRIGIIAHGDYCDAHSTYVTKHLDLTNDMAKVVQFVETCNQTGGGDAPECYELVLHEVQSFSWTAGANHSLVLIGDDLPHETHANPQKINWRAELVTLKANDIAVYAVQALNRSYATNFYFTCAKETGGIHISLDQFNAITDLLIAVCYREGSGLEHLAAFEKEVIAQGRYSRSVRQMFDQLSGREPTPASADKDLQAVPSGRFQVLDIDEDVSIKDFVVKNGLSFKTGRGFYEFTKPELIQANKEIILMDKKNGDMFEGDYARELLGLPKGVPSKIKPAEYDFVVFVQSTSYNRKLQGGTRFLYEVEDWSRGV